MSDMMGQLHYLSLHKQSVNKDSVLFYQYIKRVSEIVLTEDEYFVFWEVIDNNNQMAAIARALNVNKTVTTIKYNKALKKLKPHAEIVVDLFKLNGILTTKELKKSGKNIKTRNGV